MAVPQTELTPLAWHYANSLSVCCLGTRIQGLSILAWNGSTGPLRTLRRILPAPSLVPHLEMQLWPDGAVLSLNLEGFHNSAGSTCQTTCREAMQWQLRPLQTCRASKKGHDISRSCRDSPRRNPMASEIHTHIPHSSGAPARAIRDEPVGKYARKCYPQSYQRGSARLIRRGGPRVQTSCCH